MSFKAKIERIHRGKGIVHLDGKDIKIGPISKNDIGTEVTFVEKQGSIAYCIRPAKVDRINESGHGFINVDKSNDDGTTKWSAIPTRKGNFSVESASLNIGPINPEFAQEYVDIIHYGDNAYCITEDAVDEAYPYYHYNQISNPCQIDWYPLSSNPSEIDVEINEIRENTAYADFGEYTSLQVEIPLAGIAVELTVGDVISVSPHMSDISTSPLKMRADINDLQSERTERSQNGTADGSNRDSVIKKSDSDVPLESIPAIGETRAKELRNAGIESGLDVAKANENELQSIPKISKDTATIIRETAREACGFDDTFISTLASELEIPRAKVAEAYASLAPAIILPKEAEPTLRHLCAKTVGPSVFQLTEYSPKYRHYLLKAGFQEIKDVAEADIDELAQADYIGESLARNIKKAAQDRLPQENKKSTSLEGSPKSSQTSDPQFQWYYCTYSTPDFMDWNTTSQVVAARRYQPGTWEQDKNSTEILHFAKEGHSDLEETFIHEACKLYETAIAASNLDLDYVTVMPGHDGRIAAPLVTVAKSLTNEFEVYYKELLGRSTKSRRQRDLGYESRWENQDSTLTTTRSLDEKSVLIIDDICTTGSSFTIATKKLEQTGAGDVICLALGLTSDQRAEVDTVETPSMTVSDFTKKL